MAVEIDRSIVATARWSWYAAADDNGASIVSIPRAPVLPHHADTVLTLAERVAFGSWQAANEDDMVISGSSKVRGAWARDDCWCPASDVLVLH
jgi:hypothetical protein